MANGLEYQDNSYSVDESTGTLSVSGQNDLSAVSLPQLSTLQFDVGGADVIMDASQFDFQSVVGGMQNNYLTIQADANTPLDLGNVSFSFFNTDPTNGTAAVILLGTNGNDTLAGPEVGARFRPGAGSDSLTGSTGGDIFEMQQYLTSKDTIDGGEGDNILTYTDSTQSGTDLDHVVNVEYIALGDATTVINSVDDLVAAGNTVTIDGSELTEGHSLTFDGSKETDGSFSVQGGAGNDTITGGALDDTLAGGTGDDSLTGGSGDDSFRFDASELTAADTIDGGSGNNTMLITDGGSLDDTSFGSISNVQNLTLKTDSTTSLTLGSNTESLGLTSVDGSAATGDLTVDASAYMENVSITGGSANNVLSGGAGSDLLSGGLSDQNTIIGGVGDDTIIVANTSAVFGTVSQAGAASMTGGAATDSASGSSLASGAATGTATGTSLSGGDGNDTFIMSGYTSGASIDGGSGNNTLMIFDQNATVADLASSDITNVNTIILNGQVVTQDMLASASSSQEASLAGGSTSDSMRGGDLASANSTYTYPLDMLNR